MRKNDFLSLLVYRENLEEKQIENLEKLKKVAEKFHRDAGTYDEVKHVLNREITEKTLVLESGHQPNFLPYAGVWRKAFLLHFFDKEISALNNSRECIPLFGFADYNLCTAKWIYQNRIPAMTKDGFETIGFKISGKDRWKRFDSIEKPSEDEWMKELERIKAFYGEVMKRNREEAKKKLERLMEEMWTSYELGKSFSDVNAISLSRVCNVLLGLDVLFFRYSDVQRAGIFVEEWEKIISELERFNRLHNEIVNREGLDDIGYCGENSVPFWYHCDCGGKVPLAMVDTSSLVCSGECQACGNRHKLSLEELKNLFENMSMDAVTRNLVFSEGLGTVLFISGAGGGLRYGVISNEISREMGFNLPSTLVWPGRDYYLGVMHESALNELKKVFDLSIEDMFMLGEEEVVLKMRDKREELTEMLRNSGLSKKLVRKYKGYYISTDTQTRIAGNIFSLTPSMLDIFVSVGFDSILGSWNNALANLELDIDEGEFYRIERDVIYGDERVPRIYRNVKMLEERNDEIDLLEMFKKRNRR